MQDDRNIQILADLISIPSPSGKERKIQEYIENFLKGLNLKVRRQEVERDRFNLFVDSGSDVLISCHVDTVPPLGMREPYKPKIKEGRIFGRGSADVKGALSSLLSALEEFKEKPPVSLAFVVDEETNSALGSERMIDLLKGINKVLVLEPTYGKFCTAQEGALEFSIKVYSKSVHGAEFLRVKNPALSMYKILERIEKVLKRKVNLLKIRAGTGFYAVPSVCEALCEIKVFEGEVWEDLWKRVTLEVQKEQDVKVDLKLEDGEDYILFKRKGFADFLMKTYERATGKQAREGVMPSWTDASNYHKAGLECVVFGEGSLEDSHTDRESISFEELRRMRLFFLEIFKNLS